MDARRKFRRGKLALTVLTVVSAVSVASAMLLTHVHTETGATDEQFNGSNATTYYDKGQAPPHGFLSCWVTQTLTEYGRINVSNGATACNSLSLPNNGTAIFSSVCTFVISGGAGYAWLWDRAQPLHPDCPNPKPSGPGSE